MKFKTAFVRVFILALVLVLAACGGGGEEGSSKEGSKSESKGDQVLVFARGGDSSSLDFASTSDGESSRVTKQIFESLLDFDKDSFNVVPGLAHDWDVSEDGLSYKFYLEEGVTFHDGTDFNAEAVKVNFERWSDPDHQYAFKEDGYAYPLYGTMFGGYKGDEDHVIKEINVVGDHEIEFVLTQPLGSFLQNMGMHYFAITSPKALEDFGAKINENPVGTGPFKFVSWSKDDSIVLEKNENYRKEGLPKLDKVVYKVVPDNAARLIALRSGEIDIMDDVNPDDAAGVEADNALNLYTRGENNVGFLGFNTAKEPLNNKLVRQAINHSIEREKIADALYAGYATPAVNPLPPGYMGYNDEVEGYKFDADKAKELLAEAGYPDGFEIDLWVMPVSRPYMPDPEKAAEIIQDNLSKIGVKVKIVREEWAPYLEKTSKGDQELYLLGWSGSNGDPDYFLSSLTHGESVGGENRTFYDNAELNELLDAAKLSVDQEERARLYKEAQEIISEDSPMVTLVHSKPLVATRSAVKNYQPHPSTSDSLVEVELE
ncbi:ABC transporter substrate-binding protein [Sporosarcina sp. HYO08]|uniref:ABC transporter substrate-binding protein n=1 Tax=Sporosarcina sp. HYO08 TaxID=1759557 RepID=UPI0007964FD5|nr:ABC transporter substrate-binding protein [Sporosarcina sp. HYO08]KXH80726.1 peptide ABC transporter substrate-binding protein [Sporosarcina sp. HYO08]